jgi:soluble lytic murein transglycosylase
VLKAAALYLVLHIPFLQLADASAHGVTAAQEARLEDWRNRSEAGGVDQVLSEIQQAVSDSSWQAEGDTLDRLARGLAGRLALEKGQFDVAAQILEPWSDRVSPARPYVRFRWLQARLASAGLSEADQVGLINALRSLAADRSLPESLRFEVRLEIAQALFAGGQRSAPRAQFPRFSRRERAFEAYPSALLLVARADLQSKRPALACASLRELFSRFPAHPELKDWGLRLEANQLDGRRVPCSASERDRKTRIRRLELAGLDARATTEILSLAAKGESPAVDLMLANHWVNQGRVAEALEILLARYDEMKGSTGYLSLLAKAASRAGDSRVAVGAFERAASLLSARSRKGAEAAFLAAFTAYQFGDYDGAQSRFEKLSALGVGSRIGREARWHVAWIRYLRGDHTGALKRLQELAQATERRRRRVRGDALNRDRILYWQAMSLLRLGQRDQAARLFQSLAADASLDYYSIAAHQRLRHERLVERLAPWGSVPRLQEPEPESDSEVEEEDAPIGSALSEGDSEAEPAGEAQPQEKTSGDSVPDGAPAPPVPPSGEAAERFLVARELQLMGWGSAARAELALVETRARTSSERRRLMSEYQRAQLYNRSSTLAEITFGAERVRGGLTGARELWEAAFPRAFARFVTSMSASSGVPEELTWSIMKAESAFRSEVRSPVGAVGLMQLMPFTAKRTAELIPINRYRPETLLDPAVNIRLGTRYLQRLNEMFPGRWAVVAAAYNAGPHRAASWLRSFGHLDMDEWIEHIPFLETRNYAKKVTRFFQTYNALYGSRRPEAATDWLVRPIGLDFKSIDLKTVESW